MSSSFPECYITTHLLPGAIWKHKAVLSEEIIRHQEALIKSKSPVTAACPTRKSKPCSHWGVQREMQCAPYFVNSLQDKSSSFCRSPFELLLLLTCPLLWSKCYLSLQCSEPLLTALTFLGSKSGYNRVSLPYHPQKSKAIAPCIPELCSRQERDPRWEASLLPSSPPSDAHHWGQTRLPLMGGLVTCLQF